MSSNHLYQRLTQRQKESDSKQYYKEQCNYYDRGMHRSYYGMGQYTEYYKMRINYELMNNKIDPADFEYITKPWGDEVGELPAQLTNRDIISSKVKALIGIESKRPFNWKVIAVNREATTRKEEEEFGRMRQWVISSIMTPIEQEMAAQVAMSSNQNLSDQDIQAIQGQVQEQLKAATPESVRKYMMREHQDPAEVLGSQILTYLTYKEEIPEKFRKGCKHAAISGREVYHVGISNGEPKLTVVNPLFFDFDKSPDIDFIEEGEWATAEYRMTPSEVVGEYGEELVKEYGEEVLDEIFTRQHTATNVIDFLWTEENDLVRVVHCTWKGLRKIGFLSFQDEDGSIQERIVNESYELNPQAGDIDIRWEWIPEVHEATKIGSDKYVRMRPVPNQFKDLDNLYVCNLPYIGAVYDNDNSESTSIVDRMRPFQYLYDIIWYRAELLMAQDKGKKALFDIGAVPRSNGISLKMHEYYLDANSYGYLNPREEGNRFDREITNLVKELDLSNTSDITKYIDLANYVEQRCGEAVGIPKQLEGQIQEREAVANVRSVVTLSTNILEEFFAKHDQVKKRVLTRMIETAKVAYSVNRPRKLTYVTDDLTSHMLTIDQELLDSSTYGIFISDSGEAYATKEMLTTLAQAALQNQMVPLSTVIKVLQAQSVQDAEEFLLLGEENMREQQLEAQKIASQAEQEKLKMEQDHERAKWNHEMELMREEEKLKKERELAKQAILALGFSQNADQDQNQVADIIQLLQLSLEDKKIETQKFRDKKELDLKQQEVNIKKKQQKTSK